LQNGNDKAPVQNLWSCENFGNNGPKLTVIYFIVTLLTANTQGNIFSNHEEKNCTINPKYSCDKFHQFVERRKLRKISDPMAILAVS